jgi:hypothetical protein
MRKAGDTRPMMGKLMSGSPVPNVACRHDFDMQGE